MQLVDCTSIQTPRVSKLTILNCGLTIAEGLLSVLKEHLRSTRQIRGSEAVCWKEGNSCEKKELLKHSLVFALIRL